MQESRGLQTNGDEQKCQNTKIYYSPCNDKCKHWSNAKMHTIWWYGRIGSHVVGQEWRCWVIQQQNWSGWMFTCSQIPHCVLESQIQIHSTLQMERSRTDVQQNWLRQPEKCTSFGTYYQVLSLLTSRSTFREADVLERSTSIILWRWDHIHVDVQQHWMDQARQDKNLFAQCQKEVAACATQFKPGHWCF